jgi:heat shock protein HslJ
MGIILLLVALLSAGCGRTEAATHSVAPGGLQTFSAHGTEPGWRLEVVGGRMTLNADYGAMTLTVPAAEAVPVPGGSRYAGTEAGRPLRATVLDRICHDTMTGMPRPFTVTVEFDGRKLEGCGGEPASLLRGAWIVESIGGEPPLPDAKPTIAFGDDGRVSGRASCNSYSGAYTLTGEGLALTGLLSTMMACPPLLQRQEDALLAILKDVMRFERPPDGALVLHAVGGQAIKARRTE